MFVISYTHQKGRLLLRAQAPSALRLVRCTAFRKGIEADVAPRII
jgi:hypothetical protein